MGFSVRLIDLELHTVPGARLSAEIKAGERVGLTGSNGVGKTSLLRYLACLKRPMAMGQLLLDGKDPFHAHDLETLRGNMGYLMQEPERGVVFSGVSRDAAFGPENLGVDPEVIRKRWIGLKEKLLYDRTGRESEREKRGEKRSQNGFGDPEERSFRELSGGEKQRAALVSVLMMRAPLLLLDEPFSMLGNEEEEEILRFLLGTSKRLEQTMILVSHDPDVLRRMDRVFALEGGKLLELGKSGKNWIYREDGTFYPGFGEEPVLPDPFGESVINVAPGSSVSERRQASNESERNPGSDEGVRRTTSREGERRPTSKDVGKQQLKIPPIADHSEGKREPEAKSYIDQPRFLRKEGIDTVEVFSPVISFEDAGFRYGKKTVIQSYSAAIYPGVYYELTGGTGSGKSTLCKLMNATLLADEGRIKVKDRKLPRKNERGGGFFGRKDSLREIRQIIGYVMQHPEEQMFASTVLEDVMYGPLKAGKEKNAARQDAEDALSMLGVDEALWKRTPEKLSGGEKRRAAIAGVLAMKPEVFVLDEPFAGLDPEGCAILQETLREYVRQGRTVIVTRHGGI